jgi:ribonuclease HII
MKNIDLLYYQKGYDLIAGIDEAGRGPLAGPIVAAAVILPPNYTNELINDSKKIKAELREKVFDVIKNDSISWTFSVVSNQTIDEINILNATLLAMKKAALKLLPKPKLILIDGNRKFDFKIETQAIVKGDTLSQSIAAASIVAKVIRDRIMDRLDNYFPEYSWKKNKGYPTKLHYEAIEKFGLTPCHRKSFLKGIDFDEK